MAARSPAARIVSRKITNRCARAEERRPQIAGDRHHPRLACVALLFRLRSISQQSAGLTSTEAQH
jgi:hypothetical protein